MDSEMAIIIDMINIEFNGGSFNGSSLMKNLESLSFDQAISRNTIEKYSVVDVTLHLLYCKFILAEFLNPDWKEVYPYEKDEFGKAKIDLTASEWNEMKAKLIEYHQKMVDGVKKITFDRLDEVFTPWKCTIRQILSWLPTHDTYHTAMIRNMGVIELK